MILLLGTLSLATAAIHQDGLLHEFNDRRLKMATRSQTPDMMELSWDSNLASRIEKLPSNCSFLTHGPDYRVFLFKPDETAKHFEGLKLAQLGMLVGQLQADNKEAARVIMNSVKTEFMQKLKEHAHDPNFNLGKLEVLVPYQTKIGCADHKCTGRIEEQDGLNEHIGKQYSYNGVCLIGPKNYLEDSQGNGPPGSQCPAGTVNKEGLCAEGSTAPMAPAPLAPQPSRSMESSQGSAPTAPEQKDNSSITLNLNFYLLVITFITYQWLNAL